MSIIGISRDYGVNPSLVRIISTDDLATVTASGYLTAQAQNIYAINGGPFQFIASDMVVVYYNTSAPYYTNGSFLLATLDATFTTLITFASPAGNYLLAANNLSDVDSISTSRTNLGLGTGDSPTFAGMTLNGILNMASHLINNLSTPVASTDAANKSYVDNIATGGGEPVYAATTANLNSTYVNGVIGVGATLTDASGTFSAFTTDGQSPPVGSRILVKNQSTNLQNGVYILTINGDGISIPWVLTRASNYDNPDNINDTGTIPVINGTTLSNTGWYNTTTMVTVGTTAVTFVQFGNQGTVTNVATGTGLTGGPVTSSGTISIANGGVGPSQIASNSGAGIPVQVAFSNFNSTTSILSSSPVASGLSVSITPTASTSKILLMAMVNFGCNVSDNGFLQFFNGTSAIGIPSTVGSRTSCTSSIQGPPAQAVQPMFLLYVDAPATTSSVTYSVQAWSSPGNQGYINRSVTDANAALDPRCISTMIAVEIK